MILCAFGIWTVRKLRSIQDGFMILGELKYAGITGLAGLVAVFLLANVFLLWVPAYILAGAFSQGLFFLSLTHPVWKSYQSEREAKEVEFTRLKSRTETFASVAGASSLQEVLDKRDSRGAPILRLLCWKQNKALSHVFGGCAYEQINSKQSQQKFLSQQNYYFLGLL